MVLHSCSLLWITTLASICFKEHFRLWGVRTKLLCLSWYSNYRTHARPSAPLLGFKLLESGSLCMVFSLCIFLYNFCLVLHSWISISALILLLKILLLISLTPNLCSISQLLSQWDVVLSLHFNQQYMRQYGVYNPKNDRSKSPSQLTPPKFLSASKYRTLETVKVKGVEAKWRRSCSSRPQHAGGHLPTRGTNSDLYEHTKQHGCLPVFQIPCTVRACWDGILRLRCSNMLSFQQQQIRSPLQLKSTPDPFTTVWVA